VRDSRYAFEEDQGVRWLAGAGILGLAFSPGGVPPLERAQAGLELDRAGEQVRGFEGEGVVFFFWGIGVEELDYWRVRGAEAVGCAR